MAAQFLCESLGVEVAAVDLVARAVGEDALLESLGPSIGREAQGGLTKHQLAAHPPDLREEASTLGFPQEPVDVGGEDPLEGEIRERMLLALATTSPALVVGGFLLVGLWR